MRHLKTEQVASAPVVGFVAHSLQQLSASYRYATLLARCPAAAATVALPVIAAAEYDLQLGPTPGDMRPGPIVEARTAATLFSAELDALPWTPFERAELDWVRTEWADSVAVGTRAYQVAATGRRPLSRLVHPIFLGEFDAYALTHELMFTSAFGRRPESCSHARSPALADMLDSCLAWCIASDRLDLLGEFLICCISSAFPTRTTGA